MERDIHNLSDAELLRILNPALPVMVGDYSVPELLNVAEEEVLAIKGVGEAKARFVRKPSGPWMSVLLTNSGKRFTKR